MADIQVVPFSTVADQDTVVMSFDANPNIPTANYSDVTKAKMMEAIANKNKQAKLKKFIDAELKPAEKGSEADQLNIMFSMKG